MYWTLKSIPELHDLTPHQRRLIWSAARAKHLEQRSFFGRMLFLGLFLIAYDLLKKHHPYDSGQLIGVIAGLLFVFAIARQWYISRVRPLTWQFIAGLCPKCGEKATIGDGSCPSCRARVPSQPASC